MNKMLLLITAALFLACSSTPETYTVETIDGVRHVHNLEPKWDDEPKIELEFVRKIGYLEGKDENHQFFQVHGVMTDETGNIYVLDSGNKRVQKFDSEGKYLLTIGKEGNGPGELAFPGQMDVDEEKVFIVDPSNGKIEVFDQLGESIACINPNFMPQIVRYLGSDQLVTKLISRPPENKDQKQNLLTVFDFDGQITNQIGWCIEPDSPVLFRYLNDIYFETDDVKNIYVTFINENRFEKYNKKGELVFRADRPLNYTIAHREILSKYNTISADLTRVSGNIGVDSKGRIWISTYQETPVMDQNTGAVKNKVLALEIFDNDGVFLGKVKYPFPKSAFVKIQGESMFFTDEDYIVIHEYKIIEK